MGCQWTGSSLVHNWELQQCKEASWSFLSLSCCAYIPSPSIWLVGNGMPMDGFLIGTSSGIVGMRRGTLVFLVAMLLHPSNSCQGSRRVSIVFEGRLLAFSLPFVTLHHNILTYIILANLVGYGGLSVTSPWVIAGSPLLPHACPQH